MEISTNTAQSTTAYQQTKQKDNSSTDTSFDQYMNTQSQKDSQANNTSDSKEDYIEVSDTSKQTQTLTYTQDVAKVQTEDYDPNKKYLNLVDKYMPNYFEENGISKEDEEIIRFALADNKISEAEVRHLSFDQAKYVQKLKFDLMDYGTQNNVPVMWMEGDNPNVQHILNTTNFTKDNTFNEAIFQTFVENPLLDNHEMSKILGELSHTLKQAYTGMELGIAYHSSPSPFGLLREFENSELDYENHLTKIISQVETYANKPNDPKSQKYYDLLLSNFGKILNNYQKFQDEEVQLEQ